MGVTKISEATDYQKMRDLLAGLLNRCNEACGLAIASTASKIKTAAAADFVIDGKIYTKAATDNITVTAGAEQAVSTFCKYLVSIIADGTVTVTKGTDAATSALALLPALPASSAPLGYVEIETDASTTFTAGTTNFSAAGITDTYVDLSSVVTAS